MKDQIAQLETKLSKLSAKDQEFAQSLIKKFKQYGGLTPKQEPWIGILIERADAPAKPVVKIEVGEFGGVVALFQKAKEHLKYPRINLMCQGKPVTLSLAGQTSKAPGSINVMGEGKFPDRPWYGRVSPDGQWTPSGFLMSLPDLQEALKNLLIEFGQDPAGVAKKYGVLTGNCCFCGSPLSDLHSTAAGFGPTCADHYGLKEEWKAAVAVLKAEPESELKKAVKTAQKVSDKLCPLCDKNPVAVMVEGMGICESCKDDLEAA